MDPSILRASCGETFEIAAIENLKKNESEDLEFQKERILRMEDGRSVETLL